MEGAERPFNGRPVGVKAAKEVQRQRKIREGAMYAHVEAMKTMAAAIMWKMELLEALNLLHLMTAPNSDVSPEAREFLRLRRIQELKKLQRQMAEDDEREQLENQALKDSTGGGSVPNSEGDGGADQEGEVEGIYESDILPNEKEGFEGDADEFDREGA